MDANFGAHYQVPPLPMDYSRETRNWVGIRNNNTVAEIGEELSHMIRDGEPEVAGQVALQLTELLSAPRSDCLMDQLYRAMATPALDACARVLVRHRPRLTLLWKSENRS